jgi:hypothetical protein
MVKPLNIDKGVFRFEFANDWRKFNSSRVQAFFRAFLYRELETWHSTLETAAPEGIRIIQGRVEMIKKLLKVVEQEHMAPDTLNSVIEYAERSHA